MAIEELYLTILWYLMTSRNILLEVRNETAWVLFDNPERLNALTTEMVDGLLQEIQDLEKDGSIRIVVLRGKGGNFSSGANLEELEKFTPAQALEFHRKMNEISRIIRGSGKIYFAVFEGYSLGGAFELSLSADIRVCDEEAVMGQPEVKVGLNAGAGGNAILPSVVGRSNALYMALTGGTFNAWRAYELGIVQAVFKRERLEEELNTLISRILEKPAISVETIKRTINNSSDRDTDVLMEREAQAFSQLHSRNEVKEKIRKFLEK